jgi:hypothetical protein
MSEIRPLQPRDWGVSWFAGRALAGTCQRCQEAKPVFAGYEGGQPTGVVMCGLCYPLAIRETRLSFYARCPEMRRG